VSTDAAEGTNGAVGGHAATLFQNIDNNPSQSPVLTMCNTSSRWPGGTATTQVRVPHLTGHIE
jgi:hypothetical protein